MPFFDRIAALEREHASFAIATVVARRSPVSSHLGDRALIFADGRMEGFVGGSCSRDIVRRQALGSIRSRQPVLLQIRPEAPPAPEVAPGRSLIRDCADGDRAAERVATEGDRGIAERGATEGELGIAERDAGDNERGATITERVIVPMSCSSEGAVDVYIEPRVPLRRLVVVGFTPVGEALATIAATLDYDVVRVVADDELRDLGTSPAAARVLALGAMPDFLNGLDVDGRQALVAIVASQGHYDELALEVLQRYDVAFVGLLASRRRAANVFGILTQQGVPAERLAMIRNPVGLDIGARSPGEVAVSILAEIIANAPSAGRSANAWLADSAAIASSSLTAPDPVCGMDVETANALYWLERDGQMQYFCCAGCRASFAADPARYRVALRT